jgi:hypothetical protein
MNTTDLYPKQPTPASAADWSDAAGLQAKMIACIDELSAMSSNVGIAKHIAEYDSDQRKRALARAMVASLAGGSSAAKAEQEARASEVYAKELAVLAKQHQAAMQQIEEYTVKKLEWETARSLLSMLKETVRQL